MVKPMHDKPKVDELPELQRFTLPWFLWYGFFWGCVGIMLLFALAQAMPRGQPLLPFLKMIWGLNWTEFLKAVAIILAAYWGAWRFAVALCRLVYGARRPPLVNHPAPNPDALSESN
jgi:hypothetical protein